MLLNVLSHIAGNKKSIFKNALLRTPYSNTSLTFATTPRLFHIIFETIFLSQNALSVKFSSVRKNGIYVSDLDTPATSKVEGEESEILIFSLQGARRQRKNGTHIQKFLGQEGIKYLYPKANVIAAKSKRSKVLISKSERSRLVVVQE